MRLQTRSQHEASKALTTFISFTSVLLSPSYTNPQLDKKSLVEAFLTTVIGTSSFTYKDINQVFFNGCDGTSLMQTVFNQLPGMQFSNQLSNDPPLYQNTNPGFIGLEQSINGAKGYVSLFSCPSVHEVLLNDISDVWQKHF